MTNPAPARVLCLRVYPLPVNVPHKMCRLEIDCPNNSACGRIKEIQLRHCRPICPSAVKAQNTDAGIGHSDVQIAAYLLWRIEASNGLPALSVGNFRYGGLTGKMVSTLAELFDSLLLEQQEFIGIFKQSRAENKAHKHPMFIGYFEELLGVGKP